MKTRRFCLVSLVLVAALLALASTQPAMAQDPQPPDSKPAQAQPRLPGSLSAPQPQATGGPDDYGYTWDDGVAFGWVDATSGTDSGLSGDDQASGAVSIGFSFPFYENTYTQLFFNTNGLVTFGSSSNAWSNSYLPDYVPPNNLIAVYWGDLAVGQPFNPGKIYYQRGGSAPNRYFVLEWYSVTSCCSRPATDYKTFELILYENGDIVTQYLTLLGSVQNATVGIEDSVGVSGLQYVHNSPGLSNSKAVRFARPTPSARVQAYPLYQGQFTHADSAVSFQITVRNTGDLGDDVYDLSLFSPWPIFLYHSDGVTPLTDTDGHGTVDTGALGQGSGTTVVARILVPGAAAVGDGIAATVTARSSLNTAKSRTVTLRTAIPAPFAQAYRDNDDGALSLYLAQPGGQRTVKTFENAGGRDIAVAEAPSGGFAYVWDRGQCLDSSCNLYVRDIEYAILNRYGETVRAMSRLTDHSNATVSTYDIHPAVGVTPDGRTGVLWYRELYRNAGNNNQYNYNVYFATFDAAGHIAYGPLNLTNNTVWGDPWNAPDVPSLDSPPQLAATADNRFVLAWQQHYLASGCASIDCSINDLYYAVRDSSGNPVRGITRFTNDSPASSYHGYYSPNLTALAGNRALLTWYRGSDSDIYYAVLDSAGNVVKGQTNLSADGASNNYPDAAQLAGGKIVVAWAGLANPSIRFVVLDAAYNRVVGPSVLSNPAGTSGDDWVSVAPDNAGHAVLTWMDFDYYSRRHLYYALLDSNGTILTQPMIFRTSQASSPYIETSYSGYGNTSYSASLAAGVDGAVGFSNAPARGSPGGIAPLSVRYANHGQTVATGVVLTATLGTGLTYLSDTSGIAPAVVANEVTWNLPDLGFLDAHQFTLYVGVPPAAALGARYPVALALTANEADANPGDNTATVDVLLAAQVYLPLVRR